MNRHATRELALLITSVRTMLVLWAVIIAGALFYSIRHGYNDVITLARRDALSVFNKDQAFRQWATGHGGIYVPVSADTPPNPNLAHIPERDIVTPAGKHLTLMNPAYMLRQVMGQYAGTYGVTGRITSLKPLNPQNSPDDWERAALNAFEQGKKEVSAITDLNGEPHLRFIRPMIATEGCLKCHAAQGYKVGDIRGGVGVILPLAPYLEVFHDHRNNTLLLHLLFWAAGSASLLVMARKCRSLLFSRAKVLQDLQEMGKKLGLILDALEEGVVGVDTTGTVNFANPAAERMTGYPRDGLLRKNLHAVIHHSRRDGTPYPEKECPLFLTLKENTPFHRDDELFWRRDNTFFPADCAAKPLHRDGAIIGAVLIFHDITRELAARQMEERLRQAQKMESLGTLASGISHDFNNILMAILGNAELVLDKLPPESEERKNQEQVMTAGLRARDLIRQILCFSRKSEVERIPVQLQPIIKESLTMLRASIPATVSFRQEISPDCRQVLADPTQIQQILFNLVTNSFHAMRDTGGELVVRLSEKEVDGERADRKAVSPGRYVLLEVSDTGPGIDPSILDRIFEPYFTTKPQEEGTGLGLSVVHGIVQQHGGAITVESKPGQGTVFRVYLPLAAPIVTDKEGESHATI